MSAPDPLAAMDAVLARSDSLIDYRYDEGNGYFAEGLSFEAAKEFDNLRLARANVAELVATSRSAHAKLQELRFCQDTEDEADELATALAPFTTHGATAT